MMIQCAIYTDVALDRVCQNTIGYSGLEFVCGNTMYICAGVASDHVCQKYYRLLVIGLLLCVMSQCAIFCRRCS